MEHYTWIDFTKPFHLRVADILKFQQGQEMKVLVMDRNLEDITESCNEELNVYKPEHYFRDNYGIFTYSREANGTMNWSFGDIDNCFDLHIEYKADHWYPLIDGYLPRNDPQGLADFGNKAGWHWSKFPPTTRTGWRGPMMYWKELSKMPGIYYKNYEP